MTTPTVTPTVPPAATRHVFVYGTLRRGGSNDITRLAPAPRFVGSAQLAGQMYDLGAYPGLILGKGDGQPEEGAPVHLLECILYGADATPLARCKHYMRPEYYKISYTVRI